MSDFTALFGGAIKPTQVLKLTSGSGTFTPVPGRFYRITLQAGGGGGAPNSGVTAIGSSGGGAGECVFIEQRLYDPQSWSVGAGGVSGAAGSPTRFGSFIALGGQSTSASGNGVVQLGGGQSTTAANSTRTTMRGVPGGYGGGGLGNLPGSPGGVANTLNQGTWVGATSQTGLGGPVGTDTRGGGGGGGDSAFGQGGPGGRSGNAGTLSLPGSPGTGYGGGGGGAGAYENTVSGGPVLGGAGAGGLIIIEEYDL